MGDGTILLRARSGTDTTAAYPELLPLADALGSRSAVLDGEIVALDDQGRSDFERLQQRMGLAGAAARAARMTGRVPAHLMLFDIVHLDGRLLTGLPYAEGGCCWSVSGWPGPPGRRPRRSPGTGPRHGRWPRTPDWKG